MPSQRKRRLEHEEEPTNNLTLLDSGPSKRPKLEEHPPRKDPASFWDNLSKIWLTSRALRELNRRTKPRAAPALDDHPCEPNINPAQLKRFARHGGPNLSDLRGYVRPKRTDPGDPIMDSGQSNTRKRGQIEEEETTSSKRTKKSSAYDVHFEAHLNRFRILSEGQSKEKPCNLDDIKSRLAQRRPSLSPSQFSEEEFAQFRDSNPGAANEDSAMITSYPVISGKARFATQLNIIFQDLEDLTDGTIKKAKPDFYDGSPPREVNMKVHDALSSYITPSPTFGTPCVPNFLGEWKGPNGSLPVCKRQALYDGALGARAMQKLRSYAGHEISKNEASYTLTTTYHSSAGALFIYAHHCTPSTQPEREYEYHMTQVGAHMMIGSLDAFREGASALRNARDWAKEQRDRLINAANGV